MASAVYTNGVQVTKTPYTVNMYADVDFVYTADTEWLFDDGAVVKTNTLTASSNPTVDPAEFTLVPAAARVGERYYLTFADAVAAAQPGETVTLLEDVVLAQDTAIGAFAVDCGGHSLTVPDGVSLAFADGATLASTGVAVAGTVSFGATLNVTIPGAGQSTAVMAVPAAMADPAVAVSVGAVSDYQLVNDGGALRIYKPAPMTITVTGIVDRAGTDFNGSTVSVGYSAFDPGCYMEVEALLTVEGFAPVAYVGSLSAAGGTMVFDVPADVALRGGIRNAVVTIVGRRTPKDPQAVLPVYAGAKLLYQGAVAAVQTNGWFSTSVVGSQVVKEGGAWKRREGQTLVVEDPPAAGGKIVFSGDEGDELPDYDFDPSAAQAGQVVVVETEVSFAGAYDDFQSDVSAAQAAIRVVTDGDGALRLALLLGSAWTTNGSVVVAKDTDYAFRVTFDYRNVPTAVRYEMRGASGDYEEVASGASGVNASRVERVNLAGEGTLTCLAGADLADQIDDSLVTDADGNRYGSVAEAIGHDGLGLLWDASWAPAEMPGSFTLAANGHALRCAIPFEGVKVSLSDGVYTVVGNYFEAMDIRYGATGIETNRFTYLTNAVVQAACTNVWLLRDVDLGAAAPVPKTMALHGETNVLTGAGFAVADGQTLTVGSGFVGIAGVTGSFALEGGRYTAGAKAALADGLASGHRFAELAVAGKTGYVWQVLPGEEPVAQDEVVLPVKDADGNDAGSIALSQGWVTKTVGAGTPAEQSAALSAPQANGLTLVENRVLGLKDEPGDIPVVMPVQSSDADKVTFALGHVKVDAESCANVTYRVFKSSKPGGRDGGVSAFAGCDEEVKMDLPAAGVLYYLIEVDIGAVK